MKEELTKQDALAIFGSELPDTIQASQEQVKRLKKLAGGIAAFRSQLGSVSKKVQRLDRKIKESQDHKELCSAKRERKLLESAAEQLSTEYTATLETILADFMPDAPIEEKLFAISTGGAKYERLEPRTFGGTSGATRRLHGRPKKSEVV